MCRLYGFLANEPTKVECTLVLAQNALLHQSRADLRGKAHPDGWGISCYPDGLPQTERRATAAHEDLWFSATAERVYSHAVIAHVRRATVGGPRLGNTHPFTYRNWAFAHNGTVTGIDQVLPQLAAETAPDLWRLRQGSTDSEAVFYWLLTRMSQAGVSIDGPCLDLDHLVEQLAGAVCQLAQWSEEADAENSAQLNFLLTDGRVILASRWKNSLHWAQRVGIHDCEICGIPHIHHHSGIQYRAIVIASEPISHEPWREVPDQSILVVDDQIQLRIHPIEQLPTQPQVETQG